MPISHCKDERNRSIVSAYQSGVEYSDLAKRFGITVSRICKIIGRYGARLNDEQRHQRYGARTYRRAVWPDCPPHLQREYRRLRQIVGAPEARRQLEALEAKVAHQCPPRS